MVSVQIHQLAELLVVIEVNFPKHGRHDINTQRLLIGVYILLLQLFFHHVKKWHIFQLLGVVSLLFQLLNLGLVELGLYHEKALVVLEMEIIVDFKHRFDV